MCGNRPANRLFIDRHLFYLDDMVSSTSALSVSSCVASHFDRGWCGAAGEEITVGCLFGLAWRFASPIPSGCAHIQQPVPQQHSSTAHDGSSTRRCYPAHRALARSGFPSQHAGANHYGAYCVVICPVPQAALRLSGAMQKVSDAAVASLTSMLSLCGGMGHGAWCGVGLPCPLTPQHTVLLSRPATITTLRRRESILNFQIGAHQPAPELTATAIVQQLKSGGGAGELMNMVLASYCDGLADSLGIEITRTCGLVGQGRACKSGCVCVRVRVRARVCVGLHVRACVQLTRQKYARKNDAAQLCVLSCCECTPTCVVCAVGR